MWKKRNSTGKDKYHLTKPVRQINFTPDLEGEIWKNVRGYTGFYLVSNLGRIKRFGLNKLLKPLLNDKGYMQVCLSKYGFKKLLGVHRLVAIAFVANPTKSSTVNHKNRIKNDNRSENLEWLTLAENLEHAHRTIFNIKERELTYAEVFQIHEMDRLGYSFIKISKLFEIPKTATVRILRGEVHNLNGII